MVEARIPPGLVDLLDVREVGCTGVTLRAIRELEKVADDQELVRDCVAFLRRGLNGYASLWHLSRALNAGDARNVLPTFAAQLEKDVEESIDTAVDFLKPMPGQFETAPSSGILRRVTERLGPAQRSGGTTFGLAGADAIGPTELLNIVGTRRLAESVPTVIVTTPDRLVPAEVFATLGSPLFERIPLASFKKVVIGGDVLTPSEVGTRAALTAGHRAAAG